MIHVYAIVPRRTALPACTGLAGETLEAADRGRLRAVFGRAPGPARPGARQLHAHEAVVEALMRDGPVLPVRFGTALAGPAQLRAELQRHRRPLVSGLRRVRGHVELGVRAPLASEPPARATPAAAGGRAAPGRAYLVARAAQTRAAAGWRERCRRRAVALHGVLQARAAAAELRVLPDPRTLMAGAYLVPAGDEEHFRVLATSAAREAGLTVVLTGPWPPHSFAPRLDPGA